VQAAIPNIKLPLCRIKLMHWTASLYTRLAMAAVMSLVMSVHKSEDFDFFRDVTPCSLADMK
jgi:hypothetical protein